MKAPSARNSAIDLARIRRWVTEFATYRHNIPEERIRDWLKQFGDVHQDLAARVLDCVEFYSHDQIMAAFRSVLRGLNGWHQDDNQRVGNWRFVPYSASSGESGDAMTHKFRAANNLTSRRFNPLFIYRSDILREGLGDDDTVVLIDDFVGTGNQVCEAWDEQFGELLAAVGNVYLVVVAACQDGVQKVSNDIDLGVVAHHLLGSSDNIFSSACKHFDSDEKDELLKYCQRADRKVPRGFGDCGLVVVFAHGCPNNTIPILRSHDDKWEGLFRRFD